MGLKLPLFIIVVSVVLVKGQEESVLFDADFAPEALGPELVNNDAVVPDDKATVNGSVGVVGEEDHDEDVEAPADVKPEVAVRSGAYSMFDPTLVAAPVSQNLVQDSSDPYYVIDGRVLPSTTYNNNGQPYVITETRLRQVRANFLYWFYDQGGDENIGDYQRDIHVSSPQIHKNFNFQLPFFGFRFNYTRVSMHGYLEFSDPPNHYTYPLSFPIKDWPAVNDPSFIGIFFSKCRIGAIRTEDVDQRRPGVYFRLDRDLQTRTDQLGVEMRERLTWDIRQGVIGADSFFPKHAVTVTWKNMSFAGGIDNSLYKTNSFQMVLATDEVFTYAIFNYAEIQWSSHTEAGGDTTGGEGGVPAYIGFNAGNGTQSYEYKPYSQASVLRDLTGRGYANGFPGRHIFRIDEKIMMGTCNKDIDGANLPLVFAPESGNMLGGTIVNITGPCFQPNDKITCKFDQADVQGVVVDTNRAICVMPRMFADGYVRFEVSINTEPFKWKGRFFVETPATATEKIFFDGDEVHQKSPTQVRITWNQYNLTSNLNAGLRISLWGYRETTIRPQLEFIDLLEEGVSNAGVYIISPGNYRNRENFLTSDMQFGFIQINLTQPEENGGIIISPVLWSRPIPLGWYFGPQWERMYGQKWPERMCNNWLTSDRFLKNFAAEVPLCPCTLEHALLDKGRFLPDFDCDKDANPRCRYHWGAVHCVRSGHPSTEGSGQQCCYDRNNFLMLSYDQQFGSRPHRSHNLGFLPWNEANKVPTLSHWFHDMIPYYQCCLWQEEQAVGCETFRFERRPSQDCVAYQSPGVASVFGDPHVTTFDNIEYTFNGKGEFVLVRVDEPQLKLDVQGRFEQLPRNIYGPVQATHLTSVAMAANNSIPIEVRVRPTHAQWRYRLEVIADGRKVFFDRSSLKIQHFQGVTVYTPTYILNQSEVVVMFQSGAGVEVVENMGFLSTRVYLPWTYINRTRGLFGNWSWDMADDFTKPDGTFAGVNLNSFESVHRDFGIHWLLSDHHEDNKGSTLFYREFGRSAAYYNNVTFLPNFIKEPVNFIPSNRSVDVNRAAEICGESYQCRYDYGMSLNRDMAHFTRNYHASIVNIKNTNSKRIISCGVLETPRFGRKTNFFFTPGNKVTFECNQNFILIGDQRRTCGEDGKWNIPEFGYTECLRRQEYSSRQLGFTTGVIFIVMVPILLILGICFVCMRRIKRNNTYTSWNFAKLEPRSLTDSRANLRSQSMGNLTDTLKSDTLKTDKTDTNKSDSLPRKEPYDSPASDETVVQARGAMLNPAEVDRDSSQLDSERSSQLSTLPKKKRAYDKVYRTNEPLQGFPNEEFPEKPWDLSEEDLLSSASNEDSESNKDTLSKRSKDFEYIGKSLPRQQGRRALGPPSDSGYSTVPKDGPYGSDSQRSPTLDSPLSNYSPTYSEIYTPPISPVDSPKTSKDVPKIGAPLAPISEVPRSAPPDSMKTFTLPIQKGKSLETLIDPPSDPNQQGIFDPQQEIETFSSRTTMV